MTSAKINGLILAGGESSRMGSDKSLLNFHGRPQREYLFETLSKCCDKVLVSCNAQQQIPASLNPLPDAFPLKSPLNGILTAFQYDHSCAWLTVPVDMPNIDLKTLEYLLAVREPSKIATCFFDSDGKYPEPLFALWEANAYGELMEYYNSGKYTPRGFLMTHDVAILKSPVATMHVNINSPEELKDFQKGDYSL
jgi:molybdenum cofactor guanylyltransferase